MLRMLLKKFYHRDILIEPQYFAYGIFGTINYPLSYLIWRFLFSNGYESLSLRLVATFLCLPLVLHNFWRPKWRYWLPIYWHLTLLYCIPFFGIFMLFKNQLSFEWLMNIALGLLALMLVVELDWASFVVLYLIGAFLGWLFYLIVDGSPINMNWAHLPFALYMYGFILIIAGVFARNKEKLQTEKLKGALTTAANIAHELRTPLRTIESSSSGIQTVLPALLTGYQLAKKADLPLPYVVPLQVELLPRLLTGIQQETQYAFSFIDMLLVKMQHPDKDDKRWELYSIADNVAEALARYPFSQHDQELITWDPTNDFVVYGNRLLTMHVLFNLLKNSLYHIKAAQKGKISIWLEEGSAVNKLHFEDTGSGIPKKIQPLIFNHFFTKSPGGTGVGLSFCKSVMTSLKGKISCHSKEGEYAEFILEFPRVNSR